MNTVLKNTIENLDFSTIADERKATLQPLVDYIKAKHEAKARISLNFICTHNSRRSHLSQVWAQAMAAYYSIDNVYCYSGGTEATAMFPMAGKALETAGFNWLKISDSNNPIYALKFDKDAHPAICFSKKYDDVFNPSGEFAAIMTCSSADKGCPVILGAEQRIPITYEDPKAFDNTPLQEEKYVERSLQIATELSYVFSKV